MSKKLISLVLAAMAMTAVAGCNNNKKPSESSETGSPTETSESSESSESSEEPEPLPDEYDLLKHWKGNMEEDYYTVQESEAGTTITYADVNGEEMPTFNWVYVARSFSYDAAVVERFTEYKKFSFTGKLETTSGSNIVMVKVEGTGGTFEKKFEFKATESTYEFSTNFITDWSGVTQILFFVNRSINEVGNGTITLKKMVLSKAEVVAEHDIAPGMPKEPQGYTYYNGGESVDVMYRWGYNSQEEIATKAENGGYTFSWKAGAKGEWSFVSGWVKDGEKSLKDEGIVTLHFVVTGPAGLKVLFKFEDKGNGGNNKEFFTNLTGEEQVIDVDVKAVIANGTGAFMALIFPDAGSNAFAADGQIFLKRCYLDKVELVQPSNIIDFPDVYLDYISFKSDSYQIEQDEAHHVTTLKFGGGGEWDNVQFPIRFSDAIKDWADIKDYTRVAVELVSDVDIEVLFKAYDNGAGEHRVALKAGVKQAVSYEIADANICDLTKNFIVFVAPGVAGEAGKANVTMTGLRLVRKTANYDVAGAARINKVNNPNAQVVTLDDNGDMNVAFKAAEAGYGANMEIIVSHQDMANAKRISGVITSDVNTKILLKPGDVNANEIAIDLKAGQPFILNQEFTQAIDPAWGKIIIFFALPESEALEGNVHFGQFYLSVEEVVLPVGNFSGFAIGADDSNIFTVVALANEMAYVEVGSLLKVQTTYNYEPGMKLVTIKVAEGVVVTGTFDGEKLVNVGVTGDAAAMLKNNNEITLNGAAKYWNLDGTTEELRAQFIRRYRAAGASAWTVDNNEDHTDRIVRDEVHFVGGTGAMSIRPYSGSTNAVGLSLKSDFETATAYKNIGFWIYNSSNADIALRTWVYVQTGLNGAKEIGKLTAKAGGWTFCRMGFDYGAIYNFNVSNWNGSANALVFDNISLF